MAFDNLLIERDGAVVVVTINRPKVLNALNAPTLDELRRAILGSRPRRGHSCRGHHRRRRQVVRGRRRHQRARRPVADIEPRACARRTARLRSHRESREAGDRGDQRLRARRRLRAGDGVHAAARRRHREARSARNQSRAPARIRRHATSAAPRRQGKGDGVAPHGRGRSAPRRGAHRVWSIASSRPPS